MKQSPIYQKVFNEVEMIQLLIDGKLGLVNTIMPAKVISVNYPKATVQPLISRIYLDDNNDFQYLQYPPVENVPILSLGNNDFNISFPKPLPDDIGLLLVGQNCLTDVYGAGEPNCPRKFDFADSIFIPLFMNSNQSADDTLTINIKNKIKVKNQTNELISAIVDALESIKMATVDGIPFDPASIANIEINILKIKSFT